MVSRPSCDQNVHLRMTRLAGGVLGERVGLASVNALSDNMSLSLPPATQSSPQMEAESVTHSSIVEGLQSL